MIYVLALQQPKLLILTGVTHDNDLSRTTDLTRVRAHKYAKIGKNIDQRPTNKDEQRNHPAITNHTSTNEEN